MKKIYLIFLLIGFSFYFLSAQTKTPEWSYNSTIYEVNIRQFTQEGTFSSFKKHLPRLKELGVDILWLMPINPIGEKNRKGSLGSYYSISDYKAINPEFGTEEDFRDLVEQIHKLDMYVIIDWVANHTAWDHHWVQEHPDFFSRDSLGNFIPPVNDWSDVIDLNYDNKELWNEMIEAMTYWVKEFNIDGYRCDVAGMVPTAFWEEVRTKLDEIKPTFMLAEWETPDLHKKAFDMTYCWDIHKMMNSIYKGEKNPMDLKYQVQREIELYPTNSFRMQFTSNHDENSWNGTEFERLGEAVEMFAVLTYLMPGMPLIYSGQESGFDKRLDFFEKDIIIWNKSPFEKLYSDLNQLKKNNQSLWNGTKGGKIDFIEVNLPEKILAFSRTKNQNHIIAIFNMSELQNRVLINSKDFCGSYKDFTEGNLIQIGDQIDIKMPPWSYKVYYK